MLFVGRNAKFAGRWRTNGIILKLLKYNSAAYMSEQFRSNGNAAAKRQRQKSVRNWNLIFDASCTLARTAATDLCSAISIHAFKCLLIYIYIGSKVVPTILCLPFESSSCWLVWRIWKNWTEIRNSMRWKRVRKYWNCWTAAGVTDECKHRDTCE